MNNKRGLLLFLKEKFWIALVAGAASGLVTLFICQAVLTPLFTANTELYIMNWKPDSEVLYYDLQSSYELTRDIEVLVKGRNITEEVIDRVGLNMTSTQLSKRLNIVNPRNTRILLIEATHADPQTAAKIADTVTEVMQEQLIDIMEIDAVKSIYHAEIPEKQSFPLTWMSTLIFAIAGFLLGEFFLTTWYGLKSARE